MKEAIRFFGKDVYAIYTIDRRMFGVMEALYTGNNFTDNEVCIRMFGGDEAKLFWALTPPEKTEVIGDRTGTALVQLTSFQDADRLSAALAGDRAFCSARQLEELDFLVKGIAAQAA